MKKSSALLCIFLCGEIQNSFAEIKLNVNCMHGGNIAAYPPNAFENEKKISLSQQSFVNYLPEPFIKNFLLKLLTNKTFMVSTIIIIFLVGLFYLKKENHIQKGQV